MFMAPSYKKTGFITLLIMIVIIVLASLYFVFRDESAVQKRNNTPAASALLPDEGETSFSNLQGEPVSLAPEFGNVIVATSWASWCPMCTADIVKLGEVAQAYKDQDVIVLAVNRAEDKYTAERFLQTITVPEGVRIVLDSNDFYFKNSAGYAMPETIVYGKDGAVILQQRGELRLDELKQYIDKALE
jgi:thiol-disulfide isomerase/thioredoxin